MLLQKRKIPSDRSQVAEGVEESVKIRSASDDEEPPEEVPTVSRRNSNQQQGNDVRKTEKMFEFLGYELGAAQTQT